MEPTESTEPTEDDPHLPLPDPPHEDISLTTPRELLGWYSYGIAAEVFAVVGVGAFLPVTLEQLARERGVLFSDRTQACVGDGTSQSLSARAIGGSNADQCVIKGVFGGEVTTASFAMYTFSAAVLVQALVLVSFSSVADYGENRKRLLLGFGFTGSVASMLFIFVNPRLYLLGSLLVIVGVTCLGSSFVLLNSFLPLLAKNHPDVRNDGMKFEDAIPMENLATDATIDDSAHKNRSPELELSTNISSKGVGLGYCAAVLVQLLSIALLLSMKKIFTNPAAQSMPLRLVLLLVGCWWLAFSLPTLLYLKPRPGPPMLAAHSQPSLHTYWRQVVFAWTGLWTTIKLAARLRQAVIFLAGWFLLSDAIATVSGTAVLFARTELHMDTVPIALLSITVMLSGILGAFSWPRLSDRMGLRKPNHTIVCCICLMEIIPLYGLLGYVPLIQRWGVGGLQRAWEIYPLGVVHGFVMGGLSSYCRSFFGRLIPPGKEASFYALYAITDKGSSAVGPAVVGQIVDRTGSIRLAFAFLAVLILAPVGFMWVVDAETGRGDAVRMAARDGWGGIGSEFLGEGRGEEAEGLLGRGA